MKKIIRRAVIIKTLLALSGCVVTFNVTPPAIEPNSKSVNLKQSCFLALKPPVIAVAPSTPASAIQAINGSPNYADQLINILLSYNNDLKAAQKANETAWMAFTSKFEACQNQ